MDSVDKLQRYHHSTSVGCAGAMSSVHDVFTVSMCLS